MAKCGQCKEPVTAGYVICKDCMKKIQSLEAQLSAAKEIMHSECACESCLHSQTDYKKQPCWECLLATNTECAWYPNWEWKGETVCR